MTDGGGNGSGAQENSEFSEEDDFSFDRSPRHAKGMRATLVNENEFNKCGDSSGDAKE